MLIEMQRGSDKDKDKKKDNDNDAQPSNLPAKPSLNSSKSSPDLPSSHQVIFESYLILLD